VAIRTDWKIGRKARACSGCGKEFPFETPFHSAIWLEKEAFLRRDLCGPCFSAAPAAPYSHWIAEIPRPAERPRVFDLGLAAEFLRRLAAAGEPARAPLAWLLALLLVRKRAVRILDLPQDEKGPRVRVEFHDGNAPLEIPAPPLTEALVPSLREELGRLLELGETAT
jgi:hypothetical protein